MNLRKYARDKDCQIRIPHICNFNIETTVLCHLPGGGGGMKHHDLHASWGCSDCHGAVDGQIKTDYTHDELKLMLLEGVIRTQQQLIKAGILK